jgi:hypothetical protein
MLTAQTADFECWMSFAFVTAFYKASAIMHRMPTWKPTSMTHRAGCGIGTTWHPRAACYFGMQYTVRATQNTRFRDCTLHNISIFSKLYQQELGINTIYNSEFIS